MTDIKEFLKTVASQALATKMFYPACTPQIKVGPRGGSVLLPLRDQSSIEVALEPNLKFLRVGFITKDRGFNDQIEDQLLAGGESFSELLEVELEELGLDADRYEVDHYFDRDVRAFHFSTRIYFNVNNLAEESFKKKVGILAAAFRGVLRELVEFYV